MTKFYSSKFLFKPHLSQGTASLASANRGHLRTWYSQFGELEAVQLQQEREAEGQPSQQAGHHDWGQEKHWERKQPRGRPSLPEDVGELKGVWPELRAFRNPQRSFRGWWRSTEVRFTFSSHSTPRLDVLYQWYMDLYCRSWIASLCTRIAWYAYWVVIEVKRYVTY